MPSRPADHGGWPAQRGRRACAGLEVPRADHGGDASEVGTDLSSLKPEAFVYYLPALLRVIPIGDSYVDSLDASVLALLLPPEGRAADEEFERRMALLERSQRSALARYVDWCLDGEPGLPGRERALAYWRA